VLADELEQLFVVVGWFGGSGVGHGGKGLVSKGFGFACLLILEIKYKTQYLNTQHKHQ
jgi:hypothetical protein